MKNYSLNELAMMRQSTIAEIKAKIDEIPKGATVTAQDLVKATEGLATVRHIVSTIVYHGEYENDGYWHGGDLVGGSYGESHFKITKTIKRVTKHLAELDEEGNIVRKFDVHPRITMNLYTKTN